MSDRLLTHAERLRTRGAVRRLFETGASGFVYPFRFLYCAGEVSDPGVRVLFSVPKRYHKRANKRNLLRRRTKEAYRLNKALLPERSGAPVDLALIYSGREVADYRKIEHAVRKILEQVAQSL